MNSIAGAEALICEGNAKGAAAVGAFGKGEINMRTGSAPLTNLRLLRAGVEADGKTAVFVAAAKAPSAPRRRPPTNPAQSR